MKYFFFVFKYIFYLYKYTFFQTAFTFYLYFYSSKKCSCISSASCHNCSLTKYVISSEVNSLSSCVFTCYQGNRIQIAMVLSTAGWALHNNNNNQVQVTTTTTVTPRAQDMTSIPTPWLVLAACLLVTDLH